MVIRQTNQYSNHAIHVWSPGGEKPEAKPPEFKCEVLEPSYRQHMRYI